MAKSKEIKSFQPIVIHRGAGATLEKNPRDIVLDDMVELERRAKSERGKKIIQPEIHMDVKYRSPFLVAQLGDLQIGHEATDHLLIAEWLKWIEKNDALTVLYGDIGEGFNPEYGGTNGAALVQTPEGQESTIHTLLEALIKDQDLLGIVPSLEHEEWMKKHSGRSTYNREYLRGYVVQNGGHVNLVYPNNRQETLSISHNAGRGGSDDNPLGALFVLSSKNRGVDVFGAGHNHSRGGVGIQVGLANSKEPYGKRTVFVVTGTFKGLNPERPDILLNSSNVRPAPPGAITLHSAKLGITPEPTRKHAEALVDAERIWEASMRHRGNKDALLEDIWKASDVDKHRLELRTFGPNASEKRKADVKRPWETAHWKRVTVTLEGNLPYQLYTLAGLRVGDKTADYDQMKEILETVKRSKRVYLYLGRQMVDKDTPLRPDRRRYITELIKRFKEFGGLTDEKATDPRLLAVLYDSPLRSKAWKIQRIPGGKFYAATEIERNLNVPMMDNKGIIAFESKWNGNHGSVEKTHTFKGRFFDNMENTSSRTKAYMGTVAEMNYDIADGAELCDLYVGATKPKSGVFQLYNHAYEGYVAHINPGFLAEWQGTKTNVQEAPPSGQSVIVDPVTGLVFLGATLPHSAGLFEALTMKVGIERNLKSNTAEKWKKRLGVTSRTHFT